MKDQEVKLRKENIIKAFQGANTQGKKLLSDLFGAETLDVKITDRVKKYEDACEIDGSDPVSKEDFAFLPDKDQLAAFCHAKLMVIARALNEGWEPDWDNSNEYKYYSWFDLRSSAAGGSGFSFFVFSCDYSHSVVGSRLVFKSRELAEYAGKQFLAEYKGAFCLI